MVLSTTQSQTRLCFQHLLHHHEDMNTNFISRAVLRVTSPAFHQIIWEKLPCQIQKWKGSSNNTTTLSNIIISSMFNIISKPLLYTTLNKNSYLIIALKIQCSTQSFDYRHFILKMCVKSRAGRQFDNDNYSDIIFLDKTIWRVQ